jgi:ABC-type Fe3+-hydroxamate transport system substrate-binding protein
MYCYSYILVSCGVWDKKKKKERKNNTTPSSMNVVKGGRVWDVSATASGIKHERYVCIDLKTDLAQWIEYSSIAQEVMGSIAA